MYFGQLILKNVLRRKLRSALTLTAIATAVATVVGLRTVAVGFVDAFEQVYASHGVDLVVSRAGSADRLSSSVDMKMEDRLAQQSGVERVAGVLLETISIENRGIFGVPAMGVQRDSWMLADYKLRNDSKGFSNEAAKEVLVGAQLADRLQSKIGDKLRLIDNDFQIVGIFESPSIWENGSLILPIDELQKLTDRQGQYTYINIVLAKPWSSDTLNNAIASIQSLDAKLLPLATEKFVETDTRMNLVRAMAWLTSLIAVVIGTIGTLNSTLTSVFERTHEIGILRAIGWSKSRVIGMILLESLGLAVAASLVGIAAAGILVVTIQASPILRGLLPPQISPSIMLEGLLLAVVIGLFGAWLPAWRAVRMLPTEAFRIR